MVCLVSSVLSSLLRRDMSLNRRLFSWILGSEINPDLLPGKHRSEVEIVFSPGFLDHRSILICFQVNTGVRQRSSFSWVLGSEINPDLLSGKNRSDVEVVFFSWILVSQINPDLLSGKHRSEVEVVFFPGFLDHRSILICFQVNTGVRQRSYFFLDSSSSIKIQSRIVTLFQLRQGQGFESTISTSFQV